MRRIIAVIVLAAALSLAACGGNKTEAKNDIFTDEFFKDVILVKTSAIPSGIPKEKAAEMFDALKKLEIGEEIDRSAPEDIVVGGGVDFVFATKNGDVFSFSITGANTISAERRSGNSTETLFVRRSVSSDSLAGLYAVMIKYDYNFRAEHFKDVFKKKSKSENDIFTKTYINNVESLGIRLGHDRIDIGDGTIIDESYKSYEVPDEKPFLEFLEKLEFGDVFCKEAEDTYFIIIITITAKDGSVNEYRFLAVYAEDMAEISPDHTPVDIPLIELPDGTRYVIPYEDYGQLRYILQKDVYTMSK